MEIQAATAKKATTLNPTLAAKIFAEIQDKLQTKTMRRIIKQSFMAN